MIQIVKFDNGKYAVRKGNAFFGYSYLSHYSDYWYSDVRYLSTFGYNTMEGARERLNQYPAKASKTDYGTPIHVWKSRSG